MFSLRPLLDPLRSLWSRPTRLRCRPPRVWRLRLTGLPEEWMWRLFWSRLQRICCGALWTGTFLMTSFSHLINAPTSIKISNYPLTLFGFESCRVFRNFVMQSTFSGSVKVETSKLGLHFLHICKRQQWRKKKIILQIIKFLIEIFNAKLNPTRIQITKIAKSLATNGSPADPA